MPGRTEDREGRLDEVQRIRLLESDADRSDDRITRLVEDQRRIEEENDKRYGELLTKMDRSLNRTNIIIAALLAAGLGFAFNVLVLVVK